MMVKLKAHCVEKIWGSRSFNNLKNYESDLPLGETWEISTHPSGVSLTESGTPLSEITKLSYLAKFISTSDNLSVQVHPGDDYSLKNEGDRGKTECWFILEAKPGAGIYLGFKPNVSKYEFKQAVKNNLDITRFLNFIEVEAGDFFYLPHGTVHALGKHVLLAEVQQSSGVTYRVWDWNRLDSNGKGRELHVDKAMDVLNFDNEFNQEVLSKRLKDTFQDNTFTVSHEDFICQVKNTNESINLSAGSILNLGHEISINGVKVEAYEAVYFENERIEVTAQSPYLVISNED